MPDLDFTPPFKTVDEYRQHLERETGLRYHPVTLEALDVAPGFTEDDFGILDEVDPSIRALVETLPPQDRPILPPEPSPAVVQRAGIFLDTLDARHAAGEHPQNGHLFCRTCRPSYARGSLLRRLTLDLRFDPTIIDMRGTGWRYADGTTDATEDDTWRLQSIDELRTQAAPDMLVDRVLPAGSYGLITGRDGTYKTFLALDMACALASGQESWRGRDVGPWGPTTVYLLAGEGAGQIPARIDAWAEHHGVDVADLTDTFKILPRVPDLYAGGPGFEAVLAQAAVDKPVLIIVDTLRRASGGADQNASRDMGLVVDRLHRLQEASGGTVLVIAHTDKGDNDTRGASNIEDDADFVLHVRRKDGPLRQELTVAKMKDAADDFSSTTYPVAVGGSIVLADDAQDVAVAWASTTPRSRTIGALRQLVDPEGPAGIATLTGGGEKPALDRGSVYRALVELHREGAVEKVGQKYRLVEGWEETL